MNALRDHEVPPWSQGPTLAHRVGLRMGRELASAAREAARSADSHDIACLYAEPTTAAGAKDWPTGQSGAGPAGPT